MEKRDLVNHRLLRECTAPHSLYMTANPRSPSPSQLCRHLYTVPFSRPNQFLPGVSMPAPIARVDHGQDPYKWLEKRDAPEVLDHLKAENAWVEEQLLEQSALRETLYQEIKGRIRETDLSLPSPWGPWLYYQRTTAGDEYARHYRCPRPADGSLRVDESAEQLLLDPNQLAAGGFLSLGAF